MSLRSICHTALLLLALTCVAPALAQQASPTPDGVLVSEGTLDGYTGRYVTTDGMSFKVWREGAQLKLQPVGGAATTLVPDSETTFHVSGMAAHLEFVFDASDHIGHLLLTQGGTTIKAIREE